MYITINDEPEVFVDLNHPDIPKGLYKISNYGNIYNNITKKYRNITGRDKDGYVRAPFKSISKKAIYLYIHRLVAFHICEGYDEKTGRVYVNHNDCIRDHNYYKNLTWVTVQENNKHSYEHGSAKPNITHLHGELNGFCKYPDSTIHLICKLLQDGLTPMEIMNNFGYPKYSSNILFYDLIIRVKNRRARTFISSKYIF